jgi:hypothetical protein
MDDCNRSHQADGQAAGKAVAGAAAAAAPVNDHAKHKLENPKRANHNVDNVPDGAQTFEGEWDDEGVWFYQAYNKAIADWAVAHQKLGGPAFGTDRMTWIKPSFAWVLYRSGYGRKHNQERILKIKLSHASVAELLSECQCKHGGGGSAGRVQWDPARDLMAPDGKVPRKMLRKRAIQIGFKGRLSQLYVSKIVAVQDVTDLAHAVGAAHAKNDAAAMEKLAPSLPCERAYLPECSDEVLRQLAMLPGETADWVSAHGLGNAKLIAPS